MQELCRGGEAILGEGGSGKGNRTHWGGPGVDEGVCTHGVRAAADLRALHTLMPSTELQRDGEWVVS